MLINSDFEDAFVATHTLGTNLPGTANGKIGVAWWDNSLWAKVHLEYASESQNPHGGKFCQRVIMTSKSGAGQIQLVQAYAATVGKIYQATIWVRASQENQPVFLTLCHAGDPRQDYQLTNAMVGKEWTQLTATGRATVPGDILVRFNSHKVGVTFWVDDASLQEVLPLPL